MFVRLHAPRMLRSRDGITLEATEGLLAAGRAPAMEGTSLWSGRSPWRHVARRLRRHAGTRRRAMVPTADVDAGRTDDVAVASRRCDVARRVGGGGRTRARDAFRRRL